MGLFMCCYDLYSRKVVGWASSSRIDTDLLMMAFWHAVNLKNPPKGLTHAIFIDTKSI